MFSFRLVFPASFGSGGSKEKTLDEWVQYVKAEQEGNRKCQCQKDSEGKCVCGSDCACNGECGESV